MKHKTIVVTEDRFCPKCGLRLIEEIVMRSMIPDFYCYDGETYNNPDYDVKTGKKLYGKITYCPAKKWYNKGHYISKEIYE